jgi:hypothetical protein
MPTFRFTIRQLLGLTMAIGLAIGLWLHYTQTTTPRLFRQKEVDAAMFAEAVNHFVYIGEDAAVRELVGLASSNTDLTDFKMSKGEVWSTNERIGWMCRVLFESKEGYPLRSPMFGGLMLPQRTMPLGNWPHYPVAKSGSSCFVLSEGYMLGGVAEPAEDYVLFCRQNGVFRTKRIAVPSKQTALRDAATLRNSAEWQAIKWTDSGQGFSYSMDEKSCFVFIYEQADRIP